MADLLVAVSEGDTKFDPQHMVEVSLQRWPTADWYAPDPEPEDELAAMLAGQVTVQDDQRVLIVDFATNLRGIGVEGDDDLAAEFLALLTRSMPIPEDTIVVMNWADGIATLRPNMTPDEVHALRT